MRTADPGWIAASAGLMVVLLICRGRRFHALFPEAPLGVVTRACAVQSFAIRVAPFRSGELALPWLISRHAGVDLGASVLALVWVRLLDLWIVAGTFCLAAFAGVARVDGPLWWAVLGLFGALSLVVLLSRRLYRVLVAGLGRVFADTPLGRFTARLAGVGEAIDGLDPGQLARAAAWTGANWIALFLLFWSIIAALGVEVGAVPALFGIAAAQITSALPLPSVGSIGVHEAGWVFAFRLVGVGLEDAVVTGVAGQILTLGYSAALAVPSWLGLRRGAAPHR